MLKPPPTPMLPSAANDVSMLFGQKPIYEEMDDWEDESVEIARKGSTAALDEKEVYIPGLTRWKNEKVQMEVVEGEVEMEDLILEDEVYTGRGEKALLDDRLSASERSFVIEGSASVVESELPSVYIEQPPRPPTPTRDDYFQRRLASSCKRSASVASLVEYSPIQLARSLTENTLQSTGPFSDSSMHPLGGVPDGFNDPMTQLTMPTSNSASSLAPTIASWTSEDKSIMQVQMAWRSKPEMSRAQHVRTDSLVLRQAARISSPYVEEVPEDQSLRRPVGRKSLARFGPPQRIFNPPEQHHPTYDVDESVEYGRYDADQALLQEDQPRIPQSATVPLNLSISSRHSRYASSSSITAMAPITSVDDIPFPTLADTSGSADSIDSRRERRKSRSEKLLSFFTGFLTGAAPVVDNGEASAIKDDYEQGDGQGRPGPSVCRSDQSFLDDSVELPRATPAVASKAMPYQFEAPVARVRVMRAQPTSARRSKSNFIELQPPAFDDEDVRPPIRSSNAPYFALKPSRTVPSATSNVAPPAPTFDRKGKGRPTMSAFACAALARLPPPGKGASAAGQPVTIRESERARDLDRRKSVFEGPSRVMPRPMPMKRTIPLVGRTPGKASRARAMQRGAFDQGVKERLQEKDRERRKIERMREEEDAREQKKRRRETVIRANPLPEMYRR